MKVQATGETSLAFNIYLYQLAFKQKVKWYLNGNETAHAWRLIIEYPQTVIFTDKAHGFSKFRTISYCDLIIFVYICKCPGVNFEWI